MQFAWWLRRSAWARALAVARLFDPAVMGLPMKQWVEVPLAHAAAWDMLAESALAAMDAWRLAA